VLFVGVMLAGGSLAMLGLSVPAGRAGYHWSPVVCWVCSALGPAVTAAVSAALVSGVRIVHMVLPTVLKMPLEASAMT